ncbi:MAG: twitch domain-containing radical SAM protein [Bacteroidia bacterium]|nr:twitch domain-containing radical SAM protein [Bacteroidia bacterium]
MFFKRNKIKTVQDLKNSKAFCMNPWVHLFVSQKGTVGPCCLASWEEDKTFGNVNTQNVNEIWNGEKMRAFRKSMMADKPDERCHQCYLNEQNGLRSKRKTVNFLYAHHLPLVNDTQRNGFSKNAQPVYWDIRLSNLCNLSCRICGHHSSSSWFEDAKALGQTNYETKIHKGPANFEALVKQLDNVIDNLEELYFAGGEPLLMPEHLFLINKLIERKRFQVKLRYNTNFSQTNFKGTEFLEVWKLFDDVFIHASLDDSGARGMLQRHGLNWSQAVLNRKKMLEICPNVDFMLTPTISVFNIFSLPQFHKSLVEQQLIKIDEFIPHVLKSPPYYSIQILPVHLKEKAGKLIQDHIQWVIDYARLNPPEAPKEEHIKKWGGNFDLMGIPKVTGHGKLDIQINELKQCLEFMMSGDKSALIPEFVRISNQLDALRGEDTRASLPELAELW